MKILKLRERAKKIAIVVVGLYSLAMILNNERKKYFKKGGEKNEQKSFSERK